MTDELGKKILQTLIEIKSILQDNQHHQDETAKERSQLIENMKNLMSPQTKEIFEKFMEGVKN